MNRARYSVAATCLRIGAGSVAKPLIGQQTLLVDKRRPGPSERLSCAEPGCSNLRELTARGYEKPYCTRHRRLVGAARIGRVQRTPKWDVPVRGTCAVDGCENLQAMSVKGRFYLRPFCTSHHKTLSPQEKRTLVPTYGLRSRRVRVVDRSGYAHVLRGWDLCRRTPCGDGGVPRPPAREVRDRASHQRHS